MESILLILFAVVCGWAVQLFLTFRQSTAFNRRVVELRRKGTVVVGVAGNRYRGGRAFVALAVGPDGVVRDAITLQGWTTMARGRPLVGLVGLRRGVVGGRRELPGLTAQQRDAARQAIASLPEVTVQT